MANTWNRKGENRLRFCRAPSCWTVTGAWKGVGIRKGQFFSWITSVCLWNTYISANIWKQLIKTVTGIKRISDRFSWGFVSSYIRWSWVSSVKLTEPSLSFNILHCDSLNTDELLSPSCGTSGNNNRDYWQPDALSSAWSRRYSESHRVFGPDTPGRLLVNLTCSFGFSDFCVLLISIRTVTKCEFWF